MRGLWALAGIAAVLAVPVLLVCASVNTLLFDEGYYLRTQERYAVGHSTEYTLTQLRPVDAAIVAFFRSPDLPLPVALADAGADRAVFNDREIGHMNDVRVLVRQVGRLQNLALTLILAVGLGRVVYQGLPAVRWFSGRMLAGAVLTLLVLLGFGALTLVDFEQLFLTFHLVSFENDLWQLDPRRDNLIRFFPFEFWFDATVTVATRSVFSALVLGVGAWVTRQWVGRRYERAIS